VNFGELMMISNILISGIPYHHHQPHCWGTGLPYGLHIKRTGHNPPRGPSAGWWVLTTPNAAGTNGLTYLPKHGRVLDNKFFVPHLMTNQSRLTSAIARRSTDRGAIELLKYILYVKITLYMFLYGLV
jgi:hypothetical protein